MLVCWACEYRFHANLVERDGLLKGRTAQAGGPYRLYSCPQCFKSSKVETTSKSRMFASPPRDFSVVDYLFGWFELLSPKDFLRVVRWHQMYTDTRRHFFERDGDSLYSKGSIGGTIRQLFTGRNSTSDLEFDEWRQQREEEPIKERVRRERAQENRRKKGTHGKPAAAASQEIPHPYRILGVSIGADQTEIRAAFKRLVRTYHPDKQSTRDPKTIEAANKRLQELLDAYDELSGNS